MMFKVFRYFVRLFNLTTLAWKVATKLGIGGDCKSCDNLCKNPTPEMAATKRFFDEHTNEVGKIITALSDAKSKLVYEQMIKFRSSYDRRYNKVWSVHDQYLPKDIIKKRFLKNAVYVDCGAFDGDTVRKFATAINIYRGGGILKSSLSNRMKKISMS